MLIIAGWLRVRGLSERDRFVVAHEEIVRRARQAPGCIDLAISADALDPARINVFEAWESQADLDSWRGISPAPSEDIDILEDQVLKHVISRSGPPF
jgi:quinol monooxygenase YgiN